MSAILAQMRAILRNHSDALLSCSSCVVLYLLVSWIYIFRVPSAEAVEAGEPGHPYISGKMEAAPLSMALPDYWTNTVSMLLFGGTTLVALVQVTGCHRRHPHHRHHLHHHTSISPPSPHLLHLPLMQSLAQLRDESDMVGKIALSGKTGSPFASVRRGALRYANFWYRELDAWVRWDASRT